MAKPSAPKKGLELQQQQLTNAIKPTKDPVVQKQNEYRFQKLQDVNAQIDAQKKASIPVTPKNTSTPQGQQAIKEGIFTNKTTGVKTDKYGNPVTGKNKYGVLQTEQKLLRNTKGEYVDSEGRVLTPDEISAYNQRIKDAQVQFQTQAPNGETLYAPGHDSTIKKPGEAPQTDIVPPNQVSDEQLDGILNGTSTSTTSPIRDEPTTATADNPVVDMTTTAPTGGELTGTDQEKYTSIAIKLSKGEALTEEETRFLISQQFASSNATPDISGVQDEITKMIGESQAQFEARQAEQKKQRDTLMDEQKKLSDEQLAMKNARLDEAAGKEKQAAQSSLSFTGFGRSTAANDAMQEIQVKYNDQKQYYQDAADLQLQLSLKELQGADEAELQPYKDRISELQSKSQEIAIDNAVTVAEMNSNKGIKGLEALNNILQVLPKSTQPKVNSEASKLLGYVADEYGNPIGVDADGNPIPIPTEGTKYELYQDSYTGQAFFYDPNNPLDYFAAPGNGIGVYSSPDGSYTSSPTTSSGGMQDATQFAVENFGEDVAQYAGNCAKFVQAIYPDLPKGWKSVVERKEAIQKAVDAGIGGTDMTFAQVGDAIQTSEGDVGHSAIIGEIFMGDDGNRKGKLFEANYKTGKITYGRVIDIDDPVILGWMRSGDNKFTDTASPNEGNNLAIDDQVNGNFNFTPSELQEFRNYDAGKGPPTQTGRSQYEKDQKQAAWEQKYNLYSSLKSSGQFDLQTYDPKEYKTQAEALTKSDAGKFITASSDLQSSLKNYYDLIQQYGSFQKFGEGKRLIDSAYADLKVKWKEAANLGALTGPDLGLIEDAIPEPESGFFGGIGQKVFGGGTSAYLKSIQRTSENQKAYAKKNLGILKSLYPELIGSDIYNSYEELSNYDLTTVDAAAQDFYDSLPTQ